MVVEFQADGPGPGHQWKSVRNIGKASTPPVEILGSGRLFSFLSADVEELASMFVLVFIGDIVVTDKLPVQIANQGSDRGIVDHHVVDQEKQGAKSPIHLEAK